jgi:hypothetical protein
MIPGWWALVGLVFAVFSLWEVCGTVSPCLVYGGVYGTCDLFGERFACFGIDPSFRAPLRFDGMYPSRPRCSGKKVTALRLGSVLLSGEICIGEMCR